MRLTPTRTRWAKERRGLVGRTTYALTLADLPEYGVAAAEAAAIELPSIRGWAAPPGIPEELIEVWRASVPEHPPGTCRKHPWCRAKTHHPDCPIATR